MVALRFVTVVMALIVVLAVLPYRESEATSKIYGLSIEKTLILSKKLDYGDLIRYDNSSKQYSGKFIEKNGDYTRQCTKVKSSMGIYSYDKNGTIRILVDPCYEQKHYINLITIVSKLDEYHTKGQMKLTEIKPTNETKAISLNRTWSSDRFVNESCNDAKLSIAKFNLMLFDTISYMSHNCNGNYTKFNTNQTGIIPLTKHDISTSAKAKTEKFMAQVKSECLQKRNACTTLQNRAIISNGDTK